jgi:hypothetical protein
VALYGKYTRALTFEKLCQVKTLIDEMDPGRRIPRDMITDGDSSESTPLPDPRDKDATLEYMFEKLLTFQRRNDDDKRFDNHAEEDLIKGEPNPLATLLKENKQFAREKQYADHVVDAPFVDEDGNEWPVNCSRQEFLAQHGIYELPVTTAADLANADAITTPTAPTAFEAWEMYKGKVFLCLYTHTHTHKHTHTYTHTHTHRAKGVRHDMSAV